VPLAGKNIGDFHNFSLSDLLIVSALIITGGEAARQSQAQH
jgi:hypothetical protein